VRSEASKLKARSGDVSARGCGGVRVSPESPCSEG